MKKEFDVKCEIINATKQKIFDYIKLIKNQDNFNKWLMKMAEPNMKKEFKGTDGTIGFIYYWSGGKAGEGEKEIINIIEGEKVESEIRFVRPMKTISSVTMITESISDTQTKVTWSNASTMKYPLNILLLVFESAFEKDMDESLNNLKNILEK